MDKKLDEKIETGKMLIRNGRGYGFRDGASEMVPPVDAKVFEDFIHEGEYGAVTVTPVRRVTRVFEVVEPGNMVINTKKRLHDQLVSIIGRAVGSTERGAEVLNEMMAYASDCGERGVDWHVELLRGGR